MNEVRVYDGQGKLKKTISVKKLNKKMWKDMGININVKFKEEMRECPECNKMFPILSKFQKYCKPEGGGESACAKAAYSRKSKVPQMEKECAACGEKFMGSKARVFCQNPCKGHGKESQKGPIPRINCVVCGTEFQPKSNAGKYCGNPCNWYTNKRTDLGSKDHD